jgi:UbiD family decarboxylase
MPFQDFRAFLNALEKAGELIEVDRPVSPMLEVAKAMRKSAAVSGPAVIFKDNGTEFPLVGGVYNTRSKALIALEATEQNVFDKVLRGMAARIPPVVVTDAPVHENVLTGDAINLSKIPVAKYSPDDGGPYITAEIIVSKNPETGIPDIGHYRFEGHRQADLQLPCAAEPSFRSEHGDGASLRANDISCGAVDRRGSGHGL